MSCQQMATPGLDLPCIAFHNYDRSTVMFSLSEHKRIAAGDTTDKVLNNKVISPTAQGLLLVRDPDTMATFLYNPATSDKVRLPPLRGVDDDVLLHSHCLLSDKPSAPGCVVLLVEGGGDTAADLRVIDFSSSSHEPVITAITIDDTVTNDSSNGHDDDERPPCQTYLVESDGELYMVRLLVVLPFENGDEIDRVGVHRMDFSNRRWRNVSDLGGRAFLVSRFYFGASCSAGEHGLLPDRVYFVSARNNTLQVFDVRDGSYEVQKLDKAPEVHKAFWLLPTANPYKGGLRESVSPPSR
ncbi:unnamed protein product [Urochloa decumbens]|uniref:KIB1-4 beta-propeller domain-containing protein n=1 Tax=Urochloa decumbens TaxID=240449 RepID=A0ABC8YMU6_9POAL